MQCSNCSKVVKPVVAFDIDGTMGDYHRHFLGFAQAYLGGYRGEVWSEYAGLEPFNEWFCRIYKCDYRTWQDIKLAYRQGAQKRSMPEFAAMCDLARVTYSLGCEVWVTTTRPFQRLDGIDPDTREWLRRNRVPYEGLIYSEDKYHQLAEAVDRERVIAIFDDQADMVIEAIGVFNQLVPFLFKTQWNRMTTAFLQGDAVDALAHLNNRLAVWRSVHEAKAA